MLSVACVSILLASGQEDGRAIMGNVAVAGQLVRVKELEDLYQLDASEEKPEGMPDPSKPEGMPDPSKPEGMPDPSEPEGMPDPSEPEGMPDPSEPEGMPDPVKPEGMPDP
jgi:hypothetical protein